MPQTYIELNASGLTLRACLLSDRSPNAVRAFRARLPLDAKLMLDEWSGYVARIKPSPAIDLSVADPVVSFAYPGLLMVDATNGDLAICFGQGRLQNGLGPIPAIPLAEIGGDIEGFRKTGIRLQYDGATRIRIVQSEDQAAPLVPPRGERGRRISIELAGARVEAALLEETSPVTTASLASKLPLAGIATNTFLSGPLVRMRGRDGSEGGVGLDSPITEAKHTILYPGYRYYRAMQP